MERKPQKPSALKVANEFGLEVTFGSVSSPTDCYCF